MLQYYSFEEFYSDIKDFSKKIKESYEPDAIVAIARGGMTFGHFLAESYKMRELYSLNSVHYDETTKLSSVNVYNIPDLSNLKSILIAEDIIDSGKSMVEILRVLREKFPHLKIKVAALFYKEKAIYKPDFYQHIAKTWIDFFWDFENSNPKRL